MDSSTERDHATQQFGEEGDPPGSQDVTASTYLWDATALRDRRQATTADFSKPASADTPHGGDHLPSCSAAWKLGQDLIDQHEYEQAAECFLRMLASAEDSADYLTIEAAELAVQLCAALNRERSVGRKLQDVRRTLGQSLSQLSHEEVSSARSTLAAFVQGRYSAAYRGSQASIVSEATGVTTEGALRSAEASNAAPWGSLSEPPAVPAYVADTVQQPCLQIRFFGRFELLRDAEAVCLGRNARALAILKYLLARRRERPVAQDYLMGWLWPESGPKRARWSLNSAVCALRKLLGDCLPSLSASETILFEGGRYRLSPHIRLSADTDEFDSRYEEGRRLEKAGRMTEAVAQYEKAVKLYRDDYLIEDLYEEWTMTERERLVDAYTDALRRLANHYLKTDQPREGVRACYRVLEKDRCDEHAHRLLMECYVCLGQKARALHQYRLCEQALRNQYDMTPSPESRALYASILKGGFR